MEFKVVIGSWGAYTNNTDKALGSEWIDFAKYNSWEEIEEELKKEGFDLEGEDEELFIQDTDFEFGDFSGDNTHPKYLFNILKNSGVMENENAYKEALAFMEVRDWEDFTELVEKKGTNWDGNIIFYPDADAYDWAYDRIHESCPDDVFKWLQNYINFEKYAEESDINVTDYGVIEIME